jgi:hypothetical protein
MKVLDKYSANGLLGGIGLKIGKWNRIVFLDESKDYHKISFQASRDALLMYCLSLHIVGWLPDGEWKILQIDDATVPIKDEIVFVSRLLGLDKPLDFAKERSIMFEFSEARKIELNLTISYLVYIFLLFEWHVYFVSSGVKETEMICIQDGFVHFVSGREDMSDILDLFQAFEKDTTRYPPWIKEYIGENILLDSRGRLG